MLSARGSLAFGLSSHGTAAVGACAGRDAVPGSGCGAEPSVALQPGGPALCKQPRCAESEHLPPCLCSAMDEGWGTHRPLQSGGRLAVGLSAVGLRAGQLTEPRTHPLASPKLFSPPRELLRGMSAAGHGASAAGSWAPLSPPVPRPAHASAAEQGALLFL